MSRKARTSPGSTGELGVGHDHVERAGPAGDVGHQCGRSVRVPGGQAGPAVELEVDVGEVGVGGVGLDPGERLRLRLPLHVAHRRQVDARVRVERPAGLDLQADLARIHAQPLEPGGEVCADRLGVGVDAGRSRGSGKALRQRPPERIARGREAAPEIELARRPAAPVGGEPGQQRDQGIDRRAPDPRIGRVAPEVQMDPGDVEVRVADLALADRQHVLGRDPRLVALDRIPDRRPGGRHLGGLVAADEVGADPQTDVRSLAETPGDPARALQLGAAVEGDPDPGPDGALEQLVVLHRAVQGDPAGFGPGPQGGLQLTFPEDVAARPLLGEDPPQGQRLSWP